MDYFIEDLADIKGSKCWLGAVLGVRSLGGRTEAFLAPKVGILAELPQLFKNDQEEHWSICF